MCRRTARIIMAAHLVAVDHLRSSISRRGALVAGHQIIFHRPSDPFGRQGGDPFGRQGGDPFARMADEFARMEQMMNGMFGAPPPGFRLPAPGQPQRPPPGWHEAQPRAAGERPPARVDDPLRGVRVHEA